MIFLLCVLFYALVFIHVINYVFSCFMPLQSQLDLDGRDVVVEGYEKGNFVGPTVISRVKVSFFLNCIDNSR